MCWIVSQLGPTFRAQARAIFATHRLKRQSQNDCIPDNLIKVDRVVLNKEVKSFVTRVREKFLKFDLNARFDAIEASATLPNNGGHSLTGGQNSLVNGLKEPRNSHWSALWHTD